MVELQITVSNFETVMLYSVSLSRFSIVNVSFTLILSVFLSPGVIVHPDEGTLHHIIMYVLYSRGTSSVRKTVIDVKLETVKIPASPLEKTLYYTCIYKNVFYTYTDL